MIPASIFSLGLWAAYGLVALAAVWLLRVLIREWRKGELW